MLTSWLVRNAAGVRLAEALRGGSASLAEVGAALEALPLGARVEAMLELREPEQLALWRLAASAEPLKIGELLGSEPTKTTIWEGVNTLPAFRRFQKRVAPTGDPQALAGYNEQAMRFITGPGCFTARPTRERELPGVVMDYTLTPIVAPYGCAAPEPADRGISRFVYGGMLDFLRRVSPHVLIGKAWRGGRETSNCFMLTREA